MRIFVLYSICLLTSSAAVHADEQMAACATRDRVLAGLQHQNGEARHSAALDETGALVEIFASDETGSWTITRTSPNGIACLVTSGRAFTLAGERESHSAALGF